MLFINLVKLNKIKYVRVNWLIITFTENKFRPENLTLLFCFFSRILSYTGALIPNQTDKCFALFCPMRGCKKLINGISVHICNFNLVSFLEFQFC